MILLIIAWLWGVRLTVLLGLTALFVILDPKHDVELSMATAAFIGWFATVLTPFFPPREANETH